MANIQEKNFNSQQSKPDQVIVSPNKRRSERLKGKDVNYKEISDSDQSGSECLGPSSSKSIVVSKMNDKFSLRDYPLKAASLYVSALSFILENTIVYALKPLRTHIQRMVKSSHL